MSSLDRNELNVFKYEDSVAHNMDFNGSTILKYCTKHDCIQPREYLKMLPWESEFYDIWRNLTHCPLVTKYFVSGRGRRYAISKHVIHSVW